MFSKNSQFTPVQENAIIRDYIERENKAQKLYSHFSLNPFKSIHHVTDKPNAFPPDENSDVAYFEELIKKSEMTPKEKYSHAITNSHEYGWDCDLDDSGMKMHFPKKKTDMHLYMQPSKSK